MQEKFIYEFNFFFDEYFMINFLMSLNNNFNDEIIIIFSDIWICAKK